MATAKKRQDGELTQKIREQADVTSYQSTATADSPVHKHYSQDSSCASTSKVAENENGPKKEKQPVEMMMFKQFTNDNTFNARTFSAADHYDSSSITQQLPSNQKRLVQVAGDDGRVGNCGELDLRKY